MNKSFKKLVFTQGGPADIAYNNCINTRKELDAAGLKYEYMENAQEGHSWSTWRCDLYDLAQKIFK
jgi:enterochelin esterase family protein